MGCSGLVRVKNRLRREGVSDGNHLQDGKRDWITNWSGYMPYGKLYIHSFIYRAISLFFPPFFFLSWSIFYYAMNNNDDK